MIGKFSFFSLCFGQKSTSRLIFGAIFIHRSSPYSADRMLVLLPNWMGRVRISWFVGHCCNRHACCRRDNLTCCQDIWARARTCTFIVRGNNYVRNINSLFSIAVRAFDEFLLSPSNSIIINKCCCRCWWDKQTEQNTKKVVVLSISSLAFQMNAEDRREEEKNEMIYTRISYDCRCAGALSLPA